MDKPKVKKEDVAQFWSRYPLGSYEKDYKGDLQGFYEFLKNKRDKMGRFIYPLYDHENLGGKKVLELGCGPGYNVQNYAQNGAHIAACDITFRGAYTASNWLKKLSLKGNICTGDVEYAPFKSNTFDFVLCDGVLHHTPGIEKGLSEFYRTLNPGGNGLVSVYYDNLLLRGFMFNITRFILWILRVKFHGSVPVTLSMSKEEFGRLYDGPQNKLGTIYTRKKITHLIEKAGLRISDSQLHFFPTIFLPGGDFIPRLLHKFLDKYLGTMIYFQVTK